MQSIGLLVECHHHEVATGGQCEIDMKFDSLLSMADNLMKYKYVVKNVAAHGKTATFMPKPLYRRQWLGHALPPVDLERRPPLFADAGRLCRAQRHGPLLHRRPAEARAVDPGLRGTRPPTPTAVWCRATRRRSTWPGRCATARLPAASRCTPTARRPSGSSSAAPIRRPIRISPSRPCSWPASTASRTRSTRASRSTRTSTTCRPRKLAEIPSVPGRSPMRIDALEADHDFLHTGRRVHARLHRELHRLQARGRARPDPAAAAPLRVRALLRLLISPAGCRCSAFGPARQAVSPAARQPRAVFGPPHFLLVGGAGRTLSGRSARNPVVVAIKGLEAGTVIESPGRQVRRLDLEVGGDSTHGTGPAEQPPEHRPAVAVAAARHG